ncbi:MAG: HIT domain-containing protein [Anaerolineales bacterium]|jgi:histidine triad (HIT) family protein
MTDTVKRSRGYKVKQAFRRMLMAVARSHVAGWLVRTAFAGFPAWLPLDRLYETRTLVAFHHPTPSYPLHILIVPKRKYASLLEVRSDDLEFMQDLFETVSKLVWDFKLEEDSYRLMVNGGSAQEVGVLHFHLISDRGSG